MSRRIPGMALLSLVLLPLYALPSIAQAAPAPAPTAPTARTSARTSLTTTEFESRVIALTNARRKKIGCATLRANAALTRAARKHSKLMAAAGNLSHQLPREAGLAKRIEAAGYGTWRGLAENIAWASQSPTEVFNLWMGSSGHRANIQRCLYRDAGVGVVYTGSHVWVTLDLGRHR